MPPGCGGCLRLLLRHPVPRRSHFGATATEGEEGEDGTGGKPFILKLCPCLCDDTLLAAEHAIIASLAHLTGLIMCGASC